MVWCRELRRLRDEGESRFRDRSLLHQRYRMGNLLGKGGFSATCTWWVHWYKNLSSAAPNATRFSLVCVSARPLCQASVPARAP